MFMLVHFHVHTCSACAYLRIRSDGAYGYCIIQHVPVPLMAAACRAFRHPVIDRRE